MLKATSETKGYARDVLNPTMQLLPRRNTAKRNFTRSSVTELRFVAFKVIN